VQFHARRTLQLIASVVRCIAILIVTTRSSAAQQARAGAPSYDEIINRLAGMPTSLDSLYSEAVRRRIALDSIILADGSALLGATLSRTAVLRRMRTDPELVMHDPDSILLAYTRGLDRARGAMPRMFDTVTDGPIRVQSIPLEEAAAAPPAAYVRANQNDRADSATFLVNAHQPGGIARMNILLGVAHEAYPGNHFQTMYALAHGT